MKSESKFAAIAWLALTTYIHFHFGWWFITAVFFSIPFVFGGLWILQNRMDKLPWNWNLE